MNLIKAVFARLAELFAKAVTATQNLTLWLVLAATASFSTQANAANLITKMICDLKSYVFEDALVGACAALFISSVLVMYYVNEDNKLKGQIVGALLILAAFAGIGELLSRTRFAAC